MLTKNGGVLLPVPGSSARAGSTWIPLGLHRFLNQILFISPLFWFLELLQNKMYLLTIGRYGWGYEPDPHGNLTAWYSLRSLLPVVHDRRGLLAARRVLVRAAPHAVALAHGDRRTHRFRR